MWNPTHDSIICRRLLAVATVIMEIKDTEKTVIAKPVACRPGLSNLKSFSELLSGAVSSSSQAAFSESAVAVIRPRTVRFKPAYTSDSVGVGFS